MTVLKLSKDLSMPAVLKGSTITHRCTAGVARRSVNYPAGTGRHPVDDIQKMAITAALEKMVADGYVSICTIDKILKMTGGVPNRKDYEVLHMLHCVSFKDMSPELLRGLPVIMQRVLGAESVQFNFGPEYRKRMIEVNP